MIRSAVFSVSLLLSPVLHAAGGHDHGHAHGGEPGRPIAEYRELNPDERVIQGVLDTYARAMAEKSVPTMERAVIPGDFSTIESGHPNWTWEDFRDNHLAVELENFGDISFENRLITGEFQGDLGFAIYEYTASGKMGGKTISTSGLGTAILERGADGWRIHHLHTSTAKGMQQAPDGAGHGHEH